MVTADGSPLPPSRELLVAKAGLFVFIVMVRAIKNDLKMKKDKAEGVVEQATLVNPSILPSTQEGVKEAARHYADWHYGKASKPKWL